MNQYGGNNPSQSYGRWGQGAQISSSGLGYSAQATGEWDPGEWSQGTQYTSGLSHSAQGTSNWSQGAQGSSEWSQGAQCSSEWSQGAQGSNEWSQGAQGTYGWGKSASSKLGNQPQPVHQRLQQMAGGAAGSQHHQPASSPSGQSRPGSMSYNVTDTVPGEYDNLMHSVDMTDSWQEHSRNKLMYKNPSTYNDPSVSKKIAKNESMKNVFIGRGDGHWSSQQQDQHVDHPITSNEYSGIVGIVSQELTDAGLPSATVAKVMQAVAKNTGNNYATMSNFSDDRRPINRGNGIGAGYGRKRATNVASTRHGIGGAVPNRNSSYGSYEYDDVNPSIHNEEFDISPPSRSLNMHKRRLNMSLMGGRPNRQCHVVDEDFAPSGANYYDDEEYWLRDPQFQKPSFYGTAASRRIRSRNPILQNADGSSRIGRVRKPLDALLARRRVLLGTPKRRRGSPRLVGDVRLPRSVSMAAASTLITEVPMRGRRLVGEQVRTMRALRKETLLMRRLRASQMQRMKNLELLGYRGTVTRPTVGPFAEGENEATWDALTQGQRKQALKFRKEKGCVFYIKYNSNMVTEADLKLLAKPFGRVSRVFIMKAQETQAFMALERPGDAADMLRHYMIHPAVIKGCKILVKASSYSEWSKKAAANLKNPLTRTPARKRKKNKAANAMNQAANAMNQAANGKASTTAVASTSTTAAAASTSKTTAAASTSKITAASTSKITAATSTSGNIKDRLGRKVAKVQQPPGKKKMGGPILTPAQIAARKVARLAKRQRQKANKKRRFAETAAAEAIKKREFAETAAAEAIKKIKVNEVGDLRHVIDGFKKTDGKKQQNEETAEDQPGAQRSTSYDSVVTPTFVEDDLEYPSNLYPDEIQVPENDDPVYNKTEAEKSTSAEDPEENGVKDQSVIEIKDQSVIEIKDQSVIEVKDQSLIEVKDQSVIEIKDQSVIEVKDQSVILIEE